VEAKVEVQVEVPHPVHDPAKIVTAIYISQNMGQIFIEQVTGIRRTAVAKPDETPVDEMVEFEAHVRGWSPQTRVSQLQALLSKSEDRLLRL
jgi:hypothetical protein